MEKINFEEITLRKKLSHRGGGIEISLDTLGYEGERMAAYQNYLGGGMLGKVAVNDTVRTKNSFVEESLCKDLDRIGLELAEYYFTLTNPSQGRWESMSFEQNQRLRISEY